jgi:hypothetical protein
MQRPAMLRRSPLMRHLLVLYLVAIPTFAHAAPASWFDGLFPAQKPTHHRAAPTAPVAAPVATAKPDAAAPPLPRPRPAEVAEEQAVTPPTAATTASATKPAPVSPGPAPTETPGSAAPVPLAPAVPAPRAAAEPAATPTGPQSTAPAEGESVTPKPPRVYQTACPAVISGLVEAKPLPPIADDACGEPSPLSVTSVLVNGRMLPLTTPATFGCPMATDLPGWVAEVDNYLWSTQNTRIKAVVVGGSYECRPRHVEGGSADLSEHGRADALDFNGFQLEDGRTLTVSNDYNSADPKTAKFMHFAHDAACTSFTTVLGPDANALHHDHFHLDLGCHGKTCTFRLCE